jgi:hypothetical protein
VVEKQTQTGEVGQSVLRQINELQRMSLNELRRKWLDLFGTDPAKLSKQYLTRRLAYRIQELTYGGLSKPTREKLSNWAKDPKQTQKKSVRERTTLQLGTRLLRDWHGERYEVIVQEDGFVFQGKKYRSLSAISRSITGRHINGRRFFGLQPSSKKGDAK